jgi:2-polyprenyl-6-hydroxyphenyl methylase/3-demethylubiquinone-9 3-methyltransferase
LTSAAQRDAARFAFGENWRLFLDTVDDERIRTAEHSLRSMLVLDRLDGKSFVDVGCGSGLFSLAARNLGAVVLSFDRDPQSVACTEELKRRYRPGDAEWQIRVDDILAPGLPDDRRFDVVYSWGVLHHTGAMWAALERVCRMVAPGGKLFVALYNDQGWISRYWRLIKLLYNRGGIGRWMVVALHVPYLIGMRLVVRALVRRQGLPRGMSMWRDLHDWLGGYPFEVASPAAIAIFGRDRGLLIEQVTTAGRRHGCNEFVFSARDGS